MEQMNINADRKVEIEFSSGAGQLYNVLKPLVFEDDKLYCCVLGPDLKFGIKGFGHTPIDAVEDWEISLRKRITSPFANDEVVRYVTSALESKTHSVAAG